MGDFRNTEAHAAFDCSSNREILVIAAALRLRPHPVSPIPPDTTPDISEPPPIESTVDALDDPPAAEKPSAFRRILARAGSSCARVAHPLRAEVSTRLANARATWRSFADSYLETCAALDERAEAARYQTISNRLQFLAALSEQEAKLVRGANFSERRMHQAGSELAQEGEFLRPTFIASGWACRIKIVDGQRRQIVGFLLPGDGVGLRDEAEEASTSSILALTTVETVDASGVVDAAKANGYSGLRKCLTRASAHDEAFLANQVLRLGMLSPVDRLLHLLLELRWRLAVTRLGDGPEFPLPLTLQTLGEALCLSPGKVGRSLGALRRKRLMKTGFGRARLLDAALTANRGPFQPPLAYAGARRRIIDDAGVASSWMGGVAIR